MSRMVLSIPIFLLLAVAFGWKTYRAWNAPVSPGPPPAAELPRPSPRVEDAALAAAAVRDRGRMAAAIAMRPLFRPDRRPFQENAAASVSQRNYEAELGRFTLLGVVLLEGTEKAIVSGKAPGRAERYEVGPGDVLPGFTVREVGPEGILLEADGQTFILPMYAGAPKDPGGGSPRTESPPSTAAMPSRPPTPPPAAGVQPATGAGVPATPPGRARPAYIPGRR